MSRQWQIPKLVGKLIYLSHTRPHIGFSISEVTQFMNNPTKEHMEAMHQILRYLKMTPRKGLYFKKMSSKDIEIFINVNCARSITDYGLTSKYCTYV